MSVERTKGTPSQGPTPEERLVLAEELTAVAGELAKMRPLPSALGSFVRRAVLEHFRDSVEAGRDGVAWEHPHATITFSADWPWDRDPGKRESLVDVCRREPHMLNLLGLFGPSASLRSRQGALPASQPPPGSLPPGPLQGGGIFAEFQLEEHRARITSLAYSGLPDVAIRETSQVSGVLVISFRPFELDTSSGNLSCTMSVSLRFGPDPAHLTPSPSWNHDERGVFWESLIESFGAIWSDLFSLRTEEEGPGDDLASLPEPQPDSLPPPPTVTSTDTLELPFPIPFQRGTYLDPFAVTLTRHAHKLRFPKRWPRKGWEELKAEEVRRILGEEGKDAFGTLLKRHRGGNPRLTAVAEKRLKLQEGTKTSGYRFRDKDTNEEFLVRIFQLGTGFIELGFSFFGSSAPLTQEGRQRIREEAERARNSLFPEYVEAAITRHRLLEDSLLIMEALRDYVAVAKTNELRIPSQAFKTLLGIGNDPNWLGRIRRGLKGLANCKLRVDSFDTDRKYQAYGSYLSFSYIGAGPGGSGQGTFIIHLNPDFFRFFSIFESHRLKINGREIFRIDFTKYLPKENLQHEGPVYFVSPDSGNTFYSASEGLNPRQRNLVTWLGTQITRKKDPISRVMGDPIQREVNRRMTAGLARQDPRIYDTDFCPLLSGGRSFHGALGHMRRNPESGWKLYGSRTRATSTGGGRTEGLLAIMGFDLPPGSAQTKRRSMVREAIGDIEHVAINYLDGFVGILWKGDWITLEEARKLPTTELKQTRWFPFLPENWVDLRRKKFEKVQRERAKRGESPVAWKVTEDPQEAARSLTLLREGAQKDAEGNLPDPLWVRLHLARKERKLSQASVGKLFGVSQRAVAQWEAGPARGDDSKARGKSIPGELIPLLERWIEAGESPTAEELAARKTRRTGKKKT